MLHRLVLAATLAIAAGLVAPAPAGAAGGLLTLTFDDASRTQYEAAFPIIKEFGVPGTLFVISGKADEAQGKTAAWGMTWAEIARFRDAGWEIGAHSVTHPDLTKVPPAQLVRELDVSRDKIVRHLGVEPVSFSSPFGEYDDRTLAEITRRFSYHVGAYGGTEGRNPLGGIDPARIGRMNVEEAVGADTVCAEAERAAREGMWLVLTFHGFQAEAPGQYQTSPEAFRRMLECATALRDAGGLEIVTLRGAMERQGGR